MANTILTLVCAQITTMRQHLAHWISFTSRGTTARFADYNYPMPRPLPKRNHADPKMRQWSCCAIRLNRLQQVSA
jgi:hypothetical protein